MAIITVGISLCYSEYGLTIFNDYNDYNDHDDDQGRIEGGMGGLHPPPPDFRAKK